MYLLQGDMYVESTQAIGGQGSKDDGEHCRPNCPLAPLKCCQEQKMGDIEVCRVLKNVLIKEEENVCK